ncbi:hypothetical protein AXX17_AT1G34610 [Arabidopsis thaliana]|uniref:glutaredoxin-dependent peroxiredoxin n=1 Tax=Arabidopsis thaliana TaxID=3702 RepID=A0A178W965_ARATH|nr:hypothetical protein AXX17_AT1G34610 [Arabidopsis thaliana]
MAPIAVGDFVPDGSISFFDDDDQLQTVSVHSLVAGKKVILFGVPGAFPPTCRYKVSKHVNGFIEKAEELKSNGVDEIICLSDGSGEYIQLLGLELNVKDKGVGVRSRGFALLLDNLKVIVVNVGSGGDCSLFQLMKMTTTTMLSNLPTDLVEEIISRVRRKYMRAVRLTCKRWNGLFKSRSFTKMHIGKEEAATRELRQTRMIVMMDYNVYLMGIAVNENPSIETLEQDGNSTSPKAVGKSYKTCGSIVSASAQEMETKLLSQLKVARRIGNLFEFVNAKDMEDFLEPTLSLCRAFLLRSLGNKKGLSSNYTKEPMLLSETSFTFEVDPQECIRDIADFGSNIGLFLHFAGLDDDTSIAVADIASECVVLLLKAASREATTGFLTNLPKITQILDSWRRRKSTELHLLVLKRVLHCLGYACKQYLSQAMILSISGHDISKINAIVSEMKNSDVAGLNSVASLVAMELQRLPRCV